ncbi:MAG: class I SAM-dependent methyltransferase, partial [Candidatus Kryptoniota bacterium]
MEPEEYRTNFLLEDSYWWFVGRRKIVKQALTSWSGTKKFDRILDAGCGTGKMVEFLSTFGDTYGIELHSEGIEYCRKRALPFLAEGDISKLPFRDNSFDLVSCFDVLYHNEVNEAQALDEVYRVCTPKGFLIVTDAAFEFLRSEHDESVHGVRRYTKRTLCGAIERAGFKVVRTSYWNFFLFPAVALVRFVKNALPRHNERPVSNLKPIPQPLNGFLSWIVNAEAQLIRLTLLPFGTSIVLLAQKINRIEIKKA